MRAHRHNRPEEVPYEQRIPVLRRHGVVARFDSGASRGRFPNSSRRYGVGLRSAELGHPVEDVTPDHGFSRLRVEVPRLQAGSEY